MHLLDCDSVPLHVLRNHRDVVANYVVHPSVFLLDTSLVGFLGCQLFQELLKSCDRNFICSSGCRLKGLEKFISIFRHKTLLLKFRFESCNKHIAVYRILLQLQQLSDAHIVLVPHKLVEIVNGEGNHRISDLAFQCAHILHNFLDSVLFERWVTFWQGESLH